MPQDSHLLLGERTAREQWDMQAQLLAGLRPDLYRDVLLGEAIVLARDMSFAAIDQPARTLSFGARRQVQLIQAVMGQRLLLVLDEPCLGLDARAVQHAEVLLASERSRGAAILVAADDLAWAQRVADYIYILHEGSVAAAGTFLHLLTAGERSLQEIFYRCAPAAR